MGHGGAEMIAVEQIRRSDLSRLVEAPTAALVHVVAFTSVTVGYM